MTTSPHISTSSLPLDVLDLKHDEFYQFVQDQCGPIQADILKLQLISDASIFIECDNPTEIMTYDSVKLKELKADSCLMTTDGSFIILPGITASFSNLKKLLSKKFDENIKESRRKTILSNTSTASTGLSTSELTSSDDLRNHIVKSINQWIDKYRRDFDLQTRGTLMDGVDYNIRFIDNGLDRQSAIITCSCGTASTLSRYPNTGHFQLSNFYRHLERLSCSTMLGKLNRKMNESNHDEQIDRESQITRSSILSSSSTLVSDQSHNSQVGRRKFKSTTNDIRGRIKRRRR